MARPIVIEPVDLATTDQGGRLSLSTAIPVLLLVPLMMAVTTAGERVSGGKDQRVLEPLLLLPVPRSVVLLGKAVSSFVVGTIMLPALALPLLVGRVMPVGEAGRKVALPPSTVLAVIAIGVVVLTLLVAIGVCIGAGSRSSAEMGSVMPFVTLPIMMMSFMLGFLQLRTTVGLALVPMLGPALVARDIVAGTSELVDIAASMVVTVVLAVVLVIVSGRLLERERSVVRSTS